MQQAIMDWQNLQQKKGQSVQEYTQEFGKKALAMEFLSTNKKIYSSL